MLIYSQRNRFPTFLCPTRLPKPWREGSCSEAVTCFDDVTELVEQELVVSSSVQTLLHVAVQFVHHSLHICVLVLLDTRHSTQVATPVGAGASGSSETPSGRSSQRRLNAACF